MSKCAEQSWRLEKGDERRTIIKAAAYLTAHESFLDKGKLAQNNVKTPTFLLLYGASKEILRYWCI